MRALAALVFLATPAAASVGGDLTPVCVSIMATVAARQAPFAIFRDDEAQRIWLALTSQISGQAPPLAVSTIAVYWLADDTVRIRTYNVGGCDTGMGIKTTPNGMEHVLQSIFPVERAGPSRVTSGGLRP